MGTLTLQLHHIKISLKLNKTRIHNNFFWLPFSPLSTEKCENNTRQLFGQQNPQLLPESWKLNGNIFFKLFLSDLDKKWPRQATNNTQRETVKTSLLVANVHLPCGVSHAKRIYSLTLDNFSLSSQQLVPNYCLYPSKSSDVHRPILTK